MSGVPRPFGCRRRPRAAAKRRLNKRLHMIGRRPPSVDVARVNELYEIRRREDTEGPDSGSYAADPSAGPIKSPLFAVIHLERLG